MRSAETVIQRLKLWLLKIEVILWKWCSEGGNMFKRFLIWHELRRGNRRVKLDISEALKRKEFLHQVSPDLVGSAPKVRPLIVLEEDMVEERGRKAGSVVWRDR